MTTLNAIQRLSIEASVQPPKSIEKYFKLHFPDIAQNPENFLGKTFKELKDVHQLSTTEDLKKIDETLKSINALDEKIKVLKESNALPVDIEVLEKKKALEKEKIIDYIKVHVSLIGTDNVSQRALALKTSSAGNEFAERDFFDRLPNEVIQLIIWFSDHPWLCSLVCRRLACIAKDPQTADFFLGQLSARWNIPKEALVNMAKRLLSSEDSAQHLNFFRKMQIQYAQKNQISPANALGWMELQGEIEERLNGLDVKKRVDMLIEGIDNNDDPLTIFSILTLNKIDINHIHRILKTLNKYQNKNKKISLGIAQHLLDLFKKLPKEDSSFDKDTGEKSLDLFLGIFRRHKDFDRATDAAAAITHEADKSDALSKIAMALAKEEQFDQAVFEQVIDAASAIINKTYKSYALTAIAIVLAQKDQFERAIDLIRAITNNENKSEALTAIAMALARKDQFERAIDLVSAIPNNGDKADAQKRIAIVLAQKDQFDQAIDLVDAIKNETVKTEAKKKIAIALAQKDQFKQAIDLVNAMGDNENKLDALKEIAIVLAQKNQFERALELANTIIISRYKDPALQEIAKVLIQNSLNQVSKKANKLSNTYKNGVFITKSLALNSISSGLIEDSINKASKIINTIKDEYSKRSAFCDISELLIENGQFYKGIEIINKITHKNINEPKPYYTIIIHKISVILKKRLEVLINSNKKDQALKIVYKIESETIKTQATKDVIELLNKKDANKS